MKKDKVEGLSIALVRDQNIIWAKGFGLANKESKEPATEYTVYRAGSISKLFTATAVMQQRELGNLKLDSSIKNYIEDIQFQSRYLSSSPITLRNILSHHSGLPANYIGDPAMPPLSLNNIVKRTQALWVKYPVDQVFSYSNLAFAYAGIAAASPSGKSYEQYMNDILLPQLEMRQSRMTADASPYLAQGYTKKGKRTVEQRIWDTPAGGLESNVLDLGNFVKMIHSRGKFQSHKILNAESVKKMLSQQNTHSALDIQVNNGLGWFIHRDIVKGKVVGHDGATFAHRSRLLINPSEKVGVVVLSNSAKSTNLINKAAREAIILLTALNKNVQPKNVLARRTNYTPNNAIDLKNSNGTYASIAGRLKVENGNGKTKVSIGGKKLWAKQENTSHFSLHYKLLGLIPIQVNPLKNTKFYFDMLDISITNFSEKKQVETLIAERYGSKIRLATKVEPTPISPEWNARQGIYFQKTPVNLGELYPISNIELKVQDEFLTAKINTTNGQEVEVILIPIDEDTAYVAGYGRFLGETINFKKHEFFSLGVPYVKKGG